MRREALNHHAELSLGLGKKRGFTFQHPKSGDFLGSYGDLWRSSSDFYGGITIRIAIFWESLMAMETLNLVGDI